MADLISRRAAIYALNSEYHGMISDETMRIYEIINWLDALPSAEPERKKGHWDDEHCSECGFYVYHGDMRNFCPNCGADMRG